MGSTQTLCHFMMDVSIHHLGVHWNQATLTAALECLNMLNSANSSYLITEHKADLETIS